MPPPASLSLVALLSSLQAPATVSWSSLQSTPLTAALQAPVPPSLLSPLPPTAGLALSPAAQLFPQQIVDRIRLGVFVEMCDLLMDNITLIDQLEGLPGPPVAVPGMPRPRLREVSSLPTCFLAYAAILTTDQTTRDHLTYACLLIRESLSHDSLVWLEYDRVFRQQRALDPTNTLHPGIHTGTIISQARGFSRFCAYCREADHSNQKCALGYIHSAP